MELTGSLSFSMNLVTTWETESGRGTFLSQPHAERASLEGIENKIVDIDATITSPVNYDFHSGAMLSPSGEGMVFTQITAFYIENFSTFNLNFGGGSLPLPTFADSSILYPGCKIFYQNCLPVDQVQRFLSLDPLGNTVRIHMVAIGT